MVRRAFGHRVLLGMLVQCILLMGIVTSAGAGESTGLAYLRGQGAGECPDEKALRLAVAVRLGYDPFVSWAPKTVHVEVARDGSTVRARVFLADREGRARGSRELSGPLDECDNLVAAVALAVSIAIDPLSLNGPPAHSLASRDDGAGAPESAEARATSPRVALPDPPRVTSVGSEAVESDSRGADAVEASLESHRWFAGIGTLLVGGMVPGPTAGIAAFGRLAWGDGSVAIEARYLAPASAQSTEVQGTVEGKLYLVSVEPCLRFSSISMCGLASVGSLRAAGSSIARPLEQSAVYWALGGRAAVEVRIVEPLFVRGHLDLVGNATRTTLAIDGAAVWRAPLFAPAVGIDAVARLW